MNVKLLIGIIAFLGLLFIEQMISNHFLRRENLSLRNDKGILEIAIEGRLLQLSEAISLIDDYPDIKTWERFETIRFELFELGIKDSIKINSAMSYEIKHINRKECLKKH